MADWAISATACGKTHLILNSIFIRPSTSYRLPATPYLLSSPTMTTRNQRSEHFRQDMADILARRAEFPNAFVTVVDANLTDDQQFATIILSVMPTTAEDSVLESLKTFKRDILKDMAKTLKLRRMPNLNWKFDYTEEQAEGIESFMEDLKRKGEL